MKVTRKTMISLVSITALVLVTGCATIMSGTKQKIKIASTPTDANITISQFDQNQESAYWTGTTPATVKVNRKNSYQVKISLKGYQPVEVPIEYKSMNGWVWGNIIFGGILGTVVDTVDGAANELGPDDINVTLMRVQTSNLGNKAEADYALLSSVNAKGKVMTHKLLLHFVKQ